MYIIVGLALAGSAGSLQASVDEPVSDLSHQLHNVDLTGNGDPAIRGGYGQRSTLGDKQHAHIPGPDEPYPGDPEPNVPLVPLPPAAWAGAAMLAAIAGGRYIRRRK